MSVTSTVLLPPFRSFMAPGNLHQVEVGTRLGWTHMLSVSRGKRGPHRQERIDAFGG